MSVANPSWTLERINQMIADQVEESLNLDYKRAAALDRGKTVEITKDVSSFANSSGGVLIYGVSEDPNNKHLPGSLDPVRRSEISKEWLEATILTIQPKIETVRIHPVSAGAEHVIYVVEVEQSSTAHQARDHKYYRRWDFSARPMEDYEVRDVMNRTKHPRIELSFRIRRYIHHDRMTSIIPQKPEQRVTLLVYARNRGAVMAHHVIAKLFLPTLLLSKLEIARMSKKDGLPDLTTKILDNKEQDRGPMGNVLSDVRYEPILPELERCLGGFYLNPAAFLSENYEAPVLWRVHSDNAPPVEGETKIGKIRVDDEREE